MSEYIEIETEMSEDGRLIFLHTNLKLAPEGVESYDSAEAMAEGSPLAQALAVIEGITHLHIEDGTLTIAREPDAPWHAVVADVSAALKDFFL